MRPRLTLPGLVAIAALATVGSAWADGAFPDELQVFAPHQQPQRIVLATNYGLIITEDDGANWSFVCETAVNTDLVTTYGLGPSTLDALSGTLVLTSADDGCDWTGVDLSSSGAESLTDLFADPSRDDHVFAITFSAANGYDLFDLDHGGAFDVYPSPNALLGGVEISQSNPTEVYAVSSVYSTGDVDILRSDDGGAGWLTFDHPELDAYFAGIAAVDPTDPATVYLRLSPALGGGDALGVTHDSGATVTILFTAPGALSAFAVDVDHRWYAGDRTNDLWVSNPDGGFTLTTGPALRCLAARSGTIYGCGDEQTDGFVLGISTDRGRSFQPLVTPTTYQTASCAPVRAVCPLIDGGPSPPVDAGPPPVDAGPPLLDAGSVSMDAGHRTPDAGARDAGDDRLDAGSAALDAGARDAGERDAGREAHLDAGANDAGAAPFDAGSANPDAGATSKSGCGCTGGEGLPTLALLALATMLDRRRRLVGKFPGTSWPSEAGDPPTSSPGDR